MNLSIRQRLLLLNILPADGQDIHMLRVIRDLQGDLGFSEAELAEFEIQVIDDGRLQWNPDKEKSVEIEIGPRTQVLIQDRLRQLNEEKALTVDHLEVWDLFDCDKE